MKSELKVEFKNSDVLKDLIQKSYYDNNQKGSLQGKNYLEITPNEDVLHTILKGLNNLTIRLENEELIDGSFRFLVTENNNSINLTPISLYCITTEDGRYSFY